MRRGIPIVLVAAGVFGVLVLETVARARSLCRQADAEWARTVDPVRRRDDLRLADERDADRFFSRRESGSEAGAEGRWESDLLQTRHLIRASDSSAKRAFFKYRAVYRHGAPPETSWSRRARLMAPAAREMWRRDLADRRLPVTPLMLDLDPGDSETRRVVYSGQRRAPCERAAESLRAAGLDAAVTAGPPRYGVRPGDYWITVPADQFWPAHRRLKERIAPDLPPAVIQWT